MVQKEMTRRLDDYAHEQKSSQKDPGKQSRHKIP